MSVRFQTLFTLAVEHEYYDGICPDFRFHIPAETAAQGRRGRLLFKERDNRLFCLFEADQNGDAINPVAGTRLLIGLHLTTPHFANYSNVALSGLTPWYRNSPDPAQLSVPAQVRLAGDIIAQTLGSSDRPASISLKQEDGNILQTVDLGADQSQDVVNFDCRQLPDGFYRVTETYTGETFSHDYFRHPALWHLGVFGLIEIILDGSMYSAAADFVLQFQASASAIKYYVVADNYSQNEFDSLSVTDQGFVADGRSQLSFTRLLPGQFSADDISAALLHSGSQKLALFKSIGSEKRQNLPRTSIQLNKNGEILIPHLPSPGADRPRQEFIIYLEKP